MPASVLAIGLDRAFVALAIRPTLPRLTVERGLRQLAIAEQRTVSDLTESLLFDNASPPLHFEVVRRPAVGTARHLACSGEPVPVPLASQWGDTHDATCAVRSRWLVRDRPRPLVILVGGWLPRASILSSRLWPVSRLDRAGFDVVLPALPWQAAGLASSPFIKPFPSRDPCYNLVEMARAAGELVRLVQCARQLGHPSILLCGTSLGAHLVALFATLPAARLVDGYWLEKPLRNLSDSVRWHARAACDLRQHVADRLARVYRAVSPLERRPWVTPDRMCIVGATFDQVTPIDSVQAIADHFQVLLRPVAASHLFDPGRTQRLLDWVAR